MNDLIFGFRTLVTRKINNHLDLITLFEDNKMVIWLTCDDRRIRCM